MKNYIKQLSIVPFLLATLMFFIQCSEDVADFSYTGKIKGIVVKHQSNEPLSNVKITTAPTTNTIFTAEDGSFVIENVPMGDYAVKAELSGYVMEINSANLVNANQEVSLVFEMKDDNSFNAPPSIPQLISPSDNAFDLNQTVDLSWSSVDPDGDAITYKLIVKNGTNNQIITIQDLTETSYTLTDLSFGTNYFWQIVANDGVNDEVYSSTFKFTTSTLPQNRFHFISLIGDNHNIFSSDENGNKFRLTQENINVLRPRKNNSAGLISFLRTVDGNMHLFTSRLDGSAVTRVTQIPLAGFNNNELDYSWNANGSEIIYPNYNKLYRVNKDGSGTSLVYTTEDGSFITETAWSNDGSKIVLKTNNIDGYNARIFIIDIMGNHLETILENSAGAAGGLDISVDGTKILYTKDVSGFQGSNYRQLQTHIFIYNLTSGVSQDISSLSDIPNGFIDIDPRFSPNEAEVIFTHTSNDGVSRKDIYKVSLSSDNQGNYARTLLFENAWMPDWE